MRTNQKRATRQLVRSAAATLILTEGSTTTLHVKMLLRAKQYQVYQADVSRWLYDIACQAGWSINDNGVYRVYYIPTLTMLPG